MYEGCFLQTRLSKTVNVSVDQKTRPSIYFKTCGGAFETLSRAFETFETKSSAESLKSSAACLKSSAGCLRYNTAHAVPVTANENPNFVKSKKMFFSTPIPIM